MPETVLRGLASQYEIACLVYPDPSAGSLRGRLRRIAVELGLRLEDSMQREAKRRGIPLVGCRAGDDASVAKHLREAGIDLIVIAAFPFVLKAELFQSARYGSVNVHTSLLPRHRGPLPLFWVYHADDRETGVTLHEVTARADAGRILRQVRFDVPRGWPIKELHDRCCREGTQMLLDVLPRLEAARTEAVPQDETLATPAPRLRPGTGMVDFSSWPVERVWHFLRGTYPHFIEPLKDQQGVPLRYAEVTGFVEEHHLRAPGSVERDADQCRLFCRGGYVRLATVGGAA